MVRKQTIESVSYDLDKLKERAMDLDGATEVKTPKRETQWLITTYTSSGKHDTHSPPIAKLGLVAGSSRPLVQNKR